MQDKTTEIKWRTKTTHIDIETGEILDKWWDELKDQYLIINTKTKSHVYKSTGTRHIIYECRKSTQGKLF